MTTRSFESLMGILALACAFPARAQSQGGGTSLSQPIEAAMLVACGYERAPDSSDPFGPTSVSPNWTWDSARPKYLFSRDRMKKAPYTNPTCERYLLKRLYEQGNSSVVADRCTRVAKSLGIDSKRLNATGSDEPSDADGGLDFMSSGSSGYSAGAADASSVCDQAYDSDVPVEALFACKFKSFKAQIDSPSLNQKNLDAVLGYCKQHGINIVIQESESLANSGVDIYGNAGCGNRGGIVVVQDQHKWYDTLTNGLLGALKVGLPVASMTYISSLEQKNAGNAIKYNYKLGFPSMVNAGSMGAGYGYGYGGGGYGLGGYGGYGYGQGGYGGYGGVGGVIGGGGGYGYGYNPYGYAHGNGGVVIGGGGYPYGGVLGGPGGIGGGGGICGLCSGGGGYGGGGYGGGIPVSAAVGGLGGGGIIGGGGGSPCGMPPYAAGYLGCGAGGGGVVGGGLLGGGGIPAGAYYGPYGAGIYGNGLGGIGGLGGYGGGLGGGVGGVPGPAGTLSGNNGYPGGFAGGGYPGGGYGAGGYPGGYSYPGAAYGFPNGGGSFNPSAVAGQAQMWAAYMQQVNRQAQQQAQIGKLYSNQLKDQQAVSDKSYQTYTAYQMASMGLGGSALGGSGLGGGYGGGYGSGSYFGSTYYSPYSSAYGSAIGVPPSTGNGLNVNFSGSFGR